MLSTKLGIALNRQNVAFMRLQSKANRSVITPLSSVSNRDLHIQHCRQPVRKIHPALLSKMTPLVGIGSVRFASEDVPLKNISELPEAPAAPAESIVDVAPEIPEVAGKNIIDLTQIPDAPPIPEPLTVTDAAVEVLNAAGEPTFASLGLGGWGPVGMVQNCMEYLHIGLDLPWWVAICVGTAVVRTLIFPLVIVSQRNAAKMNNHMPQLQVLQLKMTEARQTGDAIESARYAQEMMLFMKEKELNPLKNMVVPLAQAPLFVSFFMGLRSMANTPVESLRDGGLWWFTDLTVADPYFLLPAITSATLYLTIEIGTDSARLSAQNMHVMKYVLRALPIAIFPFTMNFPAAILCYWTCSNFISLAQVAVLKIPAVRTYFKIDKMVTHNPENLPMKKKQKGFVNGIKDSWSNMKITRQIEERQQIDQIRFAKAGRGPLVKTYKYDPTKPRPATVVEAKPKDQ